MYSIINTICFIICCVGASYAGIIVILRVFKYTTLNNKIYYKKNSEDYWYGLFVLASCGFAVLIDLLIPFTNTEFNCSAFIVFGLSGWLGIVTIVYSIYYFFKTLRSKLVER